MKRGVESLWFRLKDISDQIEEQRVNAGLLAVLGDFLPGAVSLTRGASSVDNTLRVNRLEVSVSGCSQRQVFKLDTGAALSGCDEHFFREWCAPCGCEPDRDSSQSVK